MVHLPHELHLLCMKETASGRRFAQTKRTQAIKVAARKAGSGPILDMRVGVFFDRLFLATFLRRGGPALCVFLTRHVSERGGPTETTLIPSANPQPRAEENRC